MKRKVNRVGQNTLTVSLPTKWSKETNIQKGDELNVSFDKDTISFSKKEKAKQKKEITTNIDDLNYHTLARYLEALYRTNFNKITLVYSKSTIFQPKKEQDINLKNTTKKIVDRFIGAEIISQSSTKTEIECFVTEEKPDLNKIEKRIYFLLKETIDELFQAIGSDYHKFHETMYDHHDNITKFINYFLKTLYNSDRSEDEKKIAFAFYTVMDYVVDKIRHLSEKINELGCTSKTKKYLQEIFNVFFELFQMLNKKQVSKELIIKRYNIKKKIDNEKFTIKEFRVISEIMPLLDRLNEFSEYIIAKNLENE